MANKTPLASWLYSKSDELKPCFQEFDWPGRHMPGLFDFATTISWQGLEASGRGVDFQRNIALEKSVAEAIERLICLYFGFDSIGFAIASTHDPAPHAEFEALERYFINQHLKHSIPLKKISTTFNLIAQFNEIHPHTHIAFYKMATPQNLSGIVCSIFSEIHKSQALGFALCDAPEKSMLRSFLEALPNYAWQVEKKTTDRFETPWHIDTEFLEKIRPLLSSKELQTHTLRMPETKPINIPLLDFPILANAPIRTARFSIVDSWSAK